MVGRSNRGVNPLLQKGFAPNSTRGSIVAKAMVDRESSPSPNLSHAKGVQRRRPPVFLSAMPPARPSVGEIFLAALRLGCTSFGGPIAHLGYFHKEYVERRKWIDEERYADLVALCQFLPGPASSQVGFSIGLLLRGMAGGLAAWAGFTLPSAILMTGFAYGVTALGDVSHAGWLQGLKVAAVAVVAQAVILMWRNLCPDLPRSAIAAAMAGLLLLVPDAWGQIAAIALGAAGGWLWLKPGATVAGASLDRGRPHSGLPWLLLFFGLLLVLPALVRVAPAPCLAIADKFYRAGALVFGGGHTVLPLLEREVVTPGWLTHDQFLAGYGAAQAVPGPLFTFAAYLGAVMRVGPGGWLGGAWALLWMFIPALVIVLGVLPYWQKVRALPAAQAALRGANAAVVGVLLSALINPIALTGLTGWRHAAIAAAAFAALQFTKTPAWLLVVTCAGLGALFL
jgi:chromate transporter